MIQKTLNSTEQEKYVLVIPDDVEKTIRTLCACSPKIEWSGIMFYTFEGNFKDGVKITAKDIFLMDQGSAGHTTTDISNTEIAQFIVRRKLLGCCMAAIHSHHAMGAFFSGEDKNTLNVEGNDMNNFVSLVVDNKGTYVAQITRKVSREVVETIHRNVAQHYPLFNTGKTISEEFHEDNTTTSEETIIEAFPLKIVKTEGIKPDSIVERFGVVSSRPSTDSLLGNNTLLNKTKASVPSYSSNYKNWPFYKESYANKLDSAKDLTLFECDNEEDWWNMKAPKKSTDKNKNNESSSRVINEARRITAEILAGTPFTPSTLNQLLTKDTLKRIVEVYQKRFTLEEFDYWAESFVRFEMEELEGILEIDDIPIAVEEIQGLLDSAWKLVDSEYLKILCQEIQFY